MRAFPALSVSVLELTLAEMEWKIHKLLQTKNSKIMGAGQSKDSIIEIAKVGNSQLLSSTKTSLSFSHQSLQIKFLPPPPPLPSSIFLLPGKHSILPTTRSPQSLQPPSIL
jgi:hypothetical protein